MLLPLGGIALWNHSPPQQAEAQTAAAHSEATTHQDQLRHLYEERKSYLISLLLSGELPAKVSREEWDKELSHRGAIPITELADLVQDALSGNDPLLAAKARLISGNANAAAFDALQIQLDTSADPKLRLEAMRVEAQARFEASESEAALQLAEKARELHGSNSGDALGVELRADEALMLMGVGRYADADSLLAALQREAESRLDGKHPALARVLDLHAASSAALSRLSSAESDLRKTIAIREKTLGPDHPDIAALIQRLIGIIDHPYMAAPAGSNDPRHEEIAQLHERRLAILERHRGASDRTIPDEAGGAGRSLMLLGKRKEAEQFLRKAVAAEISPDDGLRIACLNLLGDLLVARGDYVAAEGFYRRELELRIANAKEERFALLDCRYDLSVVCRASGRLDEGAMILEALVEEANYISRDDPFRIVVWNHSLAELLVKQGRGEGAIPYATRASREMERFAKATGDLFSSKLDSQCSFEAQQGGTHEALIFQRLGVTYLLQRHKTFGQAQPGEEEAMGSFTRQLIDSGLSQEQADAVLRDLRREAGLD